ncbi:hypothetical protein PybrP1_002028 [[Pythium] brassicae (nom. inval.)]|nr:hypothetical protein PybrP1_002028 [[Pythium] brassicae (nom. inval.)]
MTTAAITPGNTHRARTTALDAYKAFLAAESTARPAVNAAIAADTSGRTLVLVMDKFALSLACKTTAGGKALAKNTISSYYSNVKNHYLDAFEGQRSVCERKLAKIGTTLEKHCATKDSVFTNKTPACTLKDLQALTTAIFKNAASARD